MTEYHAYLVGGEYRNSKHTQLGFIDTINAENPEEAKEMAERLIEEKEEKYGADNLKASAGYNVNMNTDEVKEAIRVYPASEKTGV